MGMPDFNPYIYAIGRILLEAPGGILLMLMYDGIRQKGVAKFGYATVLFALYVWGTVAQGSWHIALLRVFGI
jgi:hypothetical protein